jgi:O-antigen ligase
LEINDSNMNFPLKDNPVNIFTITDTQIITALWYLFAFTFPLFSVSYLRLNLGFYHLAIPLAVLFLIIVLHVINSLLTERKKDHNHIGRYGWLLIMCFLFFIWHLVAMYNSQNLSFAVKDSIRLFIGFIGTFSFLLLFPRDKKFTEKFFIFMFWGMSLLLAVTIYKSVFVFHTPYLNDNLTEINRVGKNQLAYFIAKIFPFVFFYFLFSKKKINSGLPLFIMLVSIIYSSSRGSWISTSLGLLFSLATLIFVQKGKGIKTVLKIFISVLLFMSVSLSVMSHYINLSSEVSVRLTSIFHPENMTKDQKYLGSNSYSVRGARIQQAVDGFITAPFFGVGLGNTELYAVGLVHNDYAAILLQLGLVGIILYIGILFSIFLKIFYANLTRKRYKFWMSIGALSSFITHITVSFVYDNYCSAYYWLFFALYLVVVETETSSYPNYYYQKKPIESSFSIA